MAAKKKLTPNQVTEVKIAREKGETQAALAAKYSVHTSTIRAAETSSGAYTGI